MLVLLPRTSNQPTDFLVPVVRPWATAALSLQVLVHRTLFVVPQPNPLLQFPARSHLGLLTTARLYRIILKFASIGSWGGIHKEIVACDSVGCLRADVSTGLSGPFVLYLGKIHPRPFLTNPGLPNPIGTEECQQLACALGQFDLHKQVLCVSSTWM